MQWYVYLIHLNVNVNPFKSNLIAYHYQYDKPISNLRGDGENFPFLSKLKENYASK